MRVCSGSVSLLVRISPRYADSEILGGRTSYASDVGLNPIGMMIVCVVFVSVKIGEDRAVKDAENKFQTARARGSKGGKRLLLNSSQHRAVLFFPY